MHSICRSPIGMFPRKDIAATVYLIYFLQLAMYIFFFALYFSLQNEMQISVGFFKQVFEILVAVGSRGKIREKG